MRHRPAISIPVTYVEVATLGFAVGLRSLTPFALLALAAKRQPVLWSKTFGARRPWSLFRSQNALIGLGLAAAGELVGDKLPFAPSRISPPGLAQRCISGTLAGAIRSMLDGRSALIGGVLGGLAAAGGAAAGYKVRTTAPHTSGIPDLAWAAAEDVLAIALSVLSLRRFLRS